MPTIQSHVTGFLRVVVSCYRARGWDESVGSGEGLIEVGTVRLWKRDLLGRDGSAPEKGWAR